MAADNADLAAILADYVPRGEYEEALAALDETVRERDELRAGSEATTKRLEELQKKYRTRSFKDAYEKVRRSLKVKDESADDVFELLKLEQDKDDPDEGLIRSNLEAFLEDRKHYLAQEESPRDRQRREAIPAGEGATRGASTRPGEPEMRVTRQQLGNALWMRDNQDRLLEAKRAGTLVIDED
jgi:hypothetical protein